MGFKRTSGKKDNGDDRAREIEAVRAWLAQDQGDSVQATAPTGSAHSQQGAYVQAGVPGQVGAPAPAQSKVVYFNPYAGYGGAYQGAHQAGSAPAGGPADVPAGESAHLAHPSAAQAASSGATPVPVVPLARDAAAPSPSASVADGARGEGDPQLTPQDYLRAQQVGHKGARHAAKPASRTLNAKPTAAPSAPGDAAKPTATSSTPADPAKPAATHAASGKVVSAVFDPDAAASRLKAQSASKPKAGSPGQPRAQVKVPTRGDVAVTTGPTPTKFHASGRVVDQDCVGSSYASAVQTGSVVSAEEQCERRRAFYVAQSRPSASSVAFQSDRILRAILIVATTLAVICILAWVPYGDMREYWSNMREAERKLDELATMREANDSMAEQVDYNYTEAGIIDAARSQLQMVMPGEHLVTVVGGTDLEETTTGIQDVSRDSGRNTHTWWTDIFDEVFGVATVGSTVATDTEEDPAAILTGTSEDPSAQVETDAGKEPEGDGAASGVTDGEPAATDAVPNPGADIVAQGDQG